MSHEAMRACPFLLLFCARHVPLHVGITKLFWGSDRLCARKCSCFEHLCDGECDAM